MGPDFRGIIREIFLHFWASHPLNMNFPTQNDFNLAWIRLLPLSNSQYKLLFAISVQKVLYKRPQSSLTHICIISFGWKLPLWRESLEVLVPVQHAQRGPPYHGTGKYLWGRRRSWPNLRYYPGIFKTVSLVSGVWNLDLSNTRQECCPLGLCTGCDEYTLRCASWSSFMHSAHNSVLDPIFLCFCLENLR
jgi:hypothetical protein